MVIVKGTGIVQKIKKTKYKNIVTVSDENDSELHLSVPYSKKININTNGRVCFEGVFDENSFVEIDFITRAYLEPLGFKIESKGEEVFSFEKKEKYFRVALKNINFNINKETLQVLVKVQDDEVVQKTTSFLSKIKKIAFEGLISKNVLFLTSIKG